MDKKTISSILATAIIVSGANFIYTVSAEEQIIVDKLPVETAKELPIRELRVEQHEVWSGTIADLENHIAFLIEERNTVNRELERLNAEILDTQAKIQKYLPYAENTFRSLSK